MDDIRAYLLTVIAAAVISAIALRLVHNSSMHYTVIRLLIGVFLAITVIGPITGLQLSNLTLYMDSVRDEAQKHMESGIDTASKQTAARISQGLESYILDKATSLDLDLEVCVNLADDLTVSTVSITGDASPYLRRKLNDIVCRDLGIGEESLIWN